MSFRVLVLLSASFLLHACAGAGRVYEADAVRPVRSVAVVAVDVIQPAEFDLLKPRSSGGDGPMSHANFALATPSAQVLEYVEDLRAALARLRRWNVLPSAKVEESVAMQKFVKDTTEGFQSVTPIAEGKTKYRAPKLLDFDAANKIGRAARDEIMTALHVDALAVAQYDVQLNGTSIMGIGSRYPQTSLRFQLFRKGQEKPVWQDSAKGVEMKDSVGQTGLSLDFKKITDLSRKSVKPAYEELQKRSSFK